MPRAAAWAITALSALPLDGLMMIALAPAEIRLRMSAICSAGPPLRFATITLLTLPLASACALIAQIISSRQPLPTSVFDTPSTYGPACGFAAPVLANATAAIAPTSAATATSRATVRRPRNSNFIPLLLSLTFVRRVQDADRRAPSARKRLPSSVSAKPATVAPVGTWRSPRLQSGAELMRHAPGRPASVTRATLDDLLRECKKTCCRRGRSRLSCSSGSDSTRLRIANVHRASSRCSTTFARRGSCTRAELVQATGLSRALIGQRLTALAAYGLVAEGGVGPSTGGRAPRTVRFCADAGHLLVADLGATSIDVAVADLAGGILAHAAEPADIAAGPGRRARTRRGALRRNARRSATLAGRAVRHRHRRPRPGRVRRRPPDLAADHAGLGRLRRAASASRASASRCGSTTTST